MSSSGSIVNIVSFTPSVADTAKTTNTLQNSSDKSPSSPFSESMSQFKMKDQVKGEMHTQAEDKLTIGSEDEGLDADRSMIVGLEGAWLSSTVQLPISSPLSFLGGTLGLVKSELEELPGVAPGTETGLELNLIPTTHFNLESNEVDVSEGLFEGESIDNKNPVLFRSEISEANTFEGGEVAHILENRTPTQSKPLTASMLSSDSASTRHSGQLASTVGIVESKQGVTQLSTVIDAPDMPVAVTDAARAESKKLFDTGRLFGEIQVTADAKEVLSSTSVSREEALTSAVTAKTNESPLQANLITTTAATHLDSGRVNIPINVTFGHPQWTSAMADKAAWAVSQNIQSADIQLDPPELGPIQVKIHVHQDQASVSFVSANPAVREALDQSMSRLKDLLAEQGMTLVDSGVSEHSQQRNRQGGGESELENAGLEVDTSKDLADSVILDIPTGIDYFA